MKEDIQEKIPKSLKRRIEIADMIEEFLVKYSAATGKEIQEAFGLNEEEFYEGMLTLGSLVKSIGRGLYALKEEENEVEEE